MNNTLEDALRLASKQQIGALLNLSGGHAALVEQTTINRERLARKLRAEPRSSRRHPPESSSPARIERYLADPEAAREYLEVVRWADKITCPHCDAVDKSAHLWPKESSRRAVRPGVWKCFVCRKQFTVTVGTALERSHVPLDNWLAAIHLLCHASQGVSAADIKRSLGISRKSAAAMLTRIAAALGHRSPAADRKHRSQQSGHRSRPMYVRLSFPQALSALLSHRLRDSSAEEGQITAAGNDLQEKPGELIQSV
jgi:transposase-like protein